MWFYQVGHPAKTGTWLHYNSNIMDYPHRLLNDIKTEVGKNVTQTIM